jgi:4-hydroxybenzoate polyprenyltransferase
MFGVWASWWHYWKRNQQRGGSVKGAIRFVVSIVASLAAFCAGFSANDFIYSRWYVPTQVKQYPHDGQIGLKVFVHGLYCGFACWVLVLVLGAIWIKKASRTNSN